MNKIFKCIYNHATGTFVAVSELARSNGVKSSTQRSHSPQSSPTLFKISAVFATILTALSVNTAFAAISVSNSNEQGVTNNNDKKAVAQGVNSIALGSNAQVTSTNGGNGADAEDTIAIGTNTLAKAAKYAVLIGSSAKTIDIDVPKGWTVQDGRPVQLMEHYSGNNAIAIGYQAKSSTDAVAIGKNAHSERTTDATTIAIGDDAKSFGGVAIGQKANVLKSKTGIASGSVAIGRYATVGEYGVAVGSGAIAGAKYESDDAANPSEVIQGATYGTAVGIGTRAQAQYATALGSNARVIEGATRGTAVGYQAKAQEKDAIAQGTNATAQANSSIAQGTNATAQANSSIAQGTNAKAVTAGSIALGANTIAGLADINVAPPGVPAFTTGKTLDEIRYHEREEYRYRIGKANNIAMGTGAEAAGGRIISIGEYAGAEATDGNWNVTNVNIGRAAGARSVGEDNVFMGTNAGGISNLSYNNGINDNKSNSGGGGVTDTGEKIPGLAGARNVALGLNAGASAGRAPNEFGFAGLTTGKTPNVVDRFTQKNEGTNQNVFIGESAGQDLKAGSSGNVLIGSGAGSELQSIANGHNGNYTRPEKYWQRNGGTLKNVANIGAPALIGLNVGVGPGTLNGATGDMNVAMGWQSSEGIVGSSNVSIGGQAMQMRGASREKPTDLSVGVGYAAGQNMTGMKNTAVGPYANAYGEGEVNADDTTAVGASAKANADQATAVARKAKAEGVKSLALSYGAHATGKESIAQGSLAITYDKADYDPKALAISEAQKKIAALENKLKSTQEAAQKDEKKKAEIPAIEAQLAQANQELDTAKQALQAFYAENNTKLPLVQVR